MIPVALATGAAVVLAGVNFSLAAHDDWDIRPLADGTLSPVVALDGGAWVQFLNKDDGDLPVSGTGNFNVFLRLQGSGQEWGYNTDAKNLSEEGNDTEQGRKHTRAVTLAEVPVVTEHGREFWELYVDLNEDNGSGGHISLNDVEVYLTPDPELAGYPFAPELATEVYDFTDMNHNKILVFDTNQGSGRPDVRYLVPIPDDLVIPDNCYYGSTTCTTYWVLYNEWGSSEVVDPVDPDEPMNPSVTYESDSTFEEWKFRQYPIVTVSKTMHGVANIPVEWQLTKGDDASFTFNWDGATSHGYTVTPSWSKAAPESFDVSGVITLTGDQNDDSILVELTDNFEGTSIDVDLDSCGLDSKDMNGDGVPEQHVVLANTSYQCSYALTGHPDQLVGTNEAIALTKPHPDDQVQFTSRGFADLAAEDYTEHLTGPTEVVITDNQTGTTFTQIGTANTTDPITPITYDLDFACADLVDAYDDTGTWTGQFTNTAKVMDGATMLAEATATVDVTCHAPLGSSDYRRHNERDIDWSIEKAEDLEDLRLAGETSTNAYTVTVTKSDVLGAFRYDGSFTVTNPNAGEAMVVPTLQFQPFGTLDDLLAAPAQDADCSTALSTDRSSLTVPAAASVTCLFTVFSTDDSYAGIPASPGVAEPVPAQITPPVESGSEQTDIVGEPLVVDVIDDLGTPGVEPNLTDTLDADDAGAQTVVFSYEAERACSTDAADYEQGVLQLERVLNTATIVGDDQAVHGSADAHHDVTCFAPTVAKTVDEHFTRTYTWTVDKDLATAEVHDLNFDEDLDLPYTVDVAYTAHDDEFFVEGTITVHNPSTLVMQGVQLTDVVDGVHVGRVVSCDGESYGEEGLTLDPGETVECSYVTPGLSAESQSNVATVILGDFQDTATEPIEWGDPTEEEDESITVTDNLFGDVYGNEYLGVVEATGFGTGIDVADVTLLGGVETSTTQPADARFSYVLQLSQLDGYVCDQSNTYDNTATIVAIDSGDELTDIDTVTVNCWIPTVSSLVFVNADRNVTWDIEKDFPGDYDLLAGQSIEHDYAVTVTKAVEIEPQSREGRVTVTNTNPSSSLTLDLGQFLPAGGTQHVTGCTSQGSWQDPLLTVAAGSEATCWFLVPYDAPDDPFTGDPIPYTTGTNSVEDDHVTLHGTESVTVGDDPHGPLFGGLPLGEPGDAGGNWSFEYQTAFSCPTTGYDANGFLELVDHVNTATIIETGQSDAKTVTIDCWAPTVSKDVTAHKTRYIDWEMDKSTTSPTELLLKHGQSHLIDYRVDVRYDHHDEDFLVDGTIEVTNASPLTMDGVTIEDLVDGTPATITSCDGATFTGAISIAPQDTVSCAYELAGLAGTETTNVVTITLDVDPNDGVAYRDQDTRTFDFASAVIDDVVDEQIVVTDSLFGAVHGDATLGTVVATGFGAGIAIIDPPGATPPASWETHLGQEFDAHFGYQVDVLDVPDYGCGTLQIRNTATTVTNDTGAQQSDDVLVVADVTCPTGCTLTWGYWKTHAWDRERYPEAPNGPAYDTGWDNIQGVDKAGNPEVGPDVVFYDDGTLVLTYREVLDTAVQGNYWYATAHQYIAALLNSLAGADDSVIADDLASAGGFLRSVAPDDRYNGRDGRETKQELQRLNERFASYNEGLIGPGHCDEDTTSSTA